jgi:integrase/recombinase XerD
MHYRVRNTINGQAVANELVSTNSERTLTPKQYSDLADVPPELEWLANITNAKTRRAYKVDVAEFVAFTNLKDHSELRTVARAHVIAWRKDMESRSLAPASIRRKLLALSSLFDYLCERNAVLGNPVDRVKRPASNNNEGAHRRSAMRRCGAC